MLTTSAPGPVTVRFAAASDWCVNRGQLSADWVLSLKSVQAKVKSALANPALAIPLDVQRHMEEEGQRLNDTRTELCQSRQVTTLLE